MNPQDNPTNAANNLSLPPVDSGQAPANSAVPVPAVPQAAPAPAPVAPDPAAMPVANPPAPIPQASAEDPAPLIADDADLIEKVWVEKAKQLVDQTKGDPFKQNKEINKFKADYIKKRYNKDIQLNKD